MLIYIRNFEGSGKIAGYRWETEVWERAALKTDKKDLWLFLGCLDSV